MPFLALDGINGRRGRPAIVNSSRFRSGPINADGLVEPGKQTILRLNKSVAPVSKLELNAKLAASVPLVRAALEVVVSLPEARLSLGKIHASDISVAADPSK